MLTICCGFGNFLNFCCDHPTAEGIAHHKDAHQQHGESHGEHNHSEHQENHKPDDDDCCNDFTTAFFSVFNQKVQPYTADFQVQNGVGSIVLPGITIVPYPFITDERLKWFPPPRPAPSGFDLCILNQSFLI